MTSTVGTGRFGPALADRRLTGARRYGTVLAAGLLLAACATPAPPPASADVAAPDFWSGRFAATWSDSDWQMTEERTSGRFELLTDSARSILDLSSPLGQTIARVTIDPGQATLIMEDGTRRSAASADALTEEVFGWTMPLAHLPRWLAGQIAQPGRIVDGRVVAGTDHGWSVRFDAFDSAGPRRLTLEWPARPEAGTQRIELRLIVDRTARQNRSQGGDP